MTTDNPAYQDYELHCCQCDRVVTPDEVHEANPDKSPYGPWWFHSCGDAVGTVGNLAGMTLRQAVMLKVYQRWPVPNV